MSGVWRNIPPAVWRAGQVLFSVVLLALLWQAVDGPEVLALLAGANPLWLGAAVLVLICQTLLSALRWKITAAQLGQVLGFPRAAKEYFMSQVVNQALPGAVMGDAARAVRARAEAGLLVSGQAVFFERLAGQIAMFFCMACAFVATWSLAGGLDWPPAYAASIGTAILVGLLALALVILVPQALSRRGITWLDPLHRALFARHVLPAQVGLGAVITLCNLAAFALCAGAVGIVLPWAAIFAIVPVILFSMLVPLTVSGWGVREGAAALLLPLAGTTAPEGVAVSVIFGLALLLSVLPGLIAVILK